MQTTEGQALRERKRIIELFDKDVPWLKNIGYVITAQAKEDQPE